MGGINIDINQSLCAHSSSEDSGFIGSSQKDEDLLRSLACVADKVSDQDVGDVIRSPDPLICTVEGTSTASNPIRSGIVDEVHRNTPVCLFEIGIKDGSYCNLVERFSSGLNACQGGSSSHKSVPNPVLVGMELGKRSPDQKERYRRCVLEESHEDGILGTPRAPEEQKCTLQGRTISKDRTSVGQSVFDEIDPQKRKGKEKISLTGNSGSFLKGHDNSNESVESINSKIPFSARKRAPSSFEMDMELGCSKRFRSLKGDVFLPQPILDQGGSFFNWVANVAKCMPNGASSDRPLMLAPNTSLEIPNTMVPITQAKGIDLDDGMGFQSFVKALYHPGFQGMNAAQTSIHDHKRKLDRVGMDPSHSPGGHVGSKRESFKILQAVPLSAFKKSSHLLGEFSCENVQNSTSRSAINAVSSSSSAQHVSPVVPTKSSGSRFSSNGSEFLSSTWIMRLCSKSPRTSFWQSNQDKSSASKNMFRSDHVPQIPSTNQLLKENPHLSTFKDCNDSVSDQEQTAAPSDSCFPLGSDSDQKLKCKLNPIMPSPAVKKFEPITSIFAKRLDALRQIMPSGDLRTGMSNSLCMFCGTIGHDIMTCPEVISSDRDDLLKNGRHFHCPQGNSLCIRCFHPNHWAIACPYVSVKPKFPSGITFRVSPLDIVEEQKHQTKDLLHNYNYRFHPNMVDEIHENTIIPENSHYRGSSNSQAGNRRNPVEPENSFSNIQSPDGKNVQGHMPQDKYPHS